MAGISTSLQLIDNMTGPVNSILGALNLTIGAFESMQAACDQSFDDSRIQDIREAVEQAGYQMTELCGSIAAAGQEQADFNSKMQQGAGIASGLGDKIGGFVKAFMGVAAVKKAFGWIQDSLDFTNIQTNAERQLKVVLGNVGAAEDAFQSLEETAASIQGYSLYGDEALLGGAGELATYISDVNAIDSMLHTLANYAAGMSGGGEIGYQEMVNYATQLGKALDGTYDGLTKKGFVLSDVQKEIIDNGTDMEKALVLDEVISQSWANLAAEMANTPQGKIIQMKNALGDIREEVGSRLYPAIISLVETISTNMPQIEQMVMGFAGAMEAVIFIMEGIVMGASAVYDFIAGNWPVIEPVVWGIVAAMAAYNAISLVTNGILAAQAIAAGIKAAADMLQTGATFAATVAQHGLNAALMACPITWIVVAVIALVAAFYTVVAAVNKFTGSSLSATGMIAGAFGILAAHIYNNFVVPIRNTLAALANFIHNFCNDPVAAVKALFYDMAITVIGYILNMANAIEAVINKIPGVTVDITSGLDNFYNQLKATSEAVKDEAGWVEVVGSLDYWDYGDAHSAGYSVGEGIEDSIANFSLADFFGGGLPEGEYSYTYDGMEDMVGDMGDIAGNTASIRDAVEISGENLKYLRDLAEMETVNRYTTAEITINQENHNNISSGQDLDGIMEGMVDVLLEAADMASEGVHS